MRSGETVSGETAQVQVNKDDCVWSGGPSLPQEAAGHPVVPVHAGGKGETPGGPRSSSVYCIILQLGVESQFFREKNLKH